MTTQFVLDALEQAIWQRKPAGKKALIHHSDRGSQYLSIRYTERLAQVEWETLKWMDWYNNRRLLAPIGYRPPAEAERTFYADQSRLDIAA
jgi:transposase InsO family protein